MDTRAYAVALLVTRPHCDLMLSRKGTAVKFPPHITVKGRFLSREQSLIAKAAPRIVPFLQAAIGDKLMLSPIREVSKNLYWREVQSGDRVYKKLLRLHKLCDVLLTPFVFQDQTPEKYKGNHFCPHVTMAWWSQNEEIDKYDIIDFVEAGQQPICVSFSRIVLFEYAADPHCDEVITHVLS